MRGVLLVVSLLGFAASSSAQALGASFILNPQTPPVATPPPEPAPAPPILRPATPTFPADAKFGFVNLQTIGQESVAGKAANLRLKAFQDSKAVELQVKTLAVKNLQDKQNAATLLAPAAAAQLQKDLERAQMDLQYAQQVAQKEYDDLQRDVMSAFADRVSPVIESVRAEKGLWAIWAMDESLAAMMPGLDLSMEVVKRLDALK